ncbi:hypothetical protein EDC01DRAFT_761788 [Geopyxis carbonaria]|nr:hypothetical protein EDC01DRAFT_761788 [Geopyxis carbonaria]
MRPHHLRHAARTLFPHCRLRSALPSPLAAPALTSTSYRPLRVHMRTFLVPKWLEPRAPPPTASHPPGKVTLDLLVRHLDAKLGQAPQLPRVINAFGDFVRYFTGTGRAPAREDIAALWRAYDWIEATAKTKGAPRLHWAVCTELLELLGTCGPEVLTGGGQPALQFGTVVFEGMYMIEQNRTPPKGLLLPYLALLTRAGDMDRAAATCRRFDAELDWKTRWVCWEVVVAARARGTDEAALLRLVAELEPLVVPDGRREAAVFSHVIAFYCANRDLASARRWYELATKKHALPLPTLATMLAACARSDQRWGDELLDTALAAAERAAPPELLATWQAALRYVAASRLGAEAVEAVRELLRRRDDRHGAGVPPMCIELVSAVLEAALETRSPALEALCDELIATHSLTPDLRTLELQMQALLDRGNVAGAESLFDAMRVTVDIPRAYPAVQPLRLLRLLASAPLPHLPRVAALYSDLHRWGVHPDADTLCALLTAFLRESSFTDVAQLITRHAAHIPPAARTRVIALLVAHCGAPTTHPDAAQETYMLLIRHLPAVSRADRTRLMSLFFTLDRPSFAAKILTDMTLSESRSRRPDAYTYTTALAACARAGSLEALGTITRCLNTDPHVDPDTRLRNALMSANARCGLAQRAWLVFADTMRSREGPDGATFSIAFDACGRDRDRAAGFARAQRIWTHALQSGRRGLNENNLAAYVECMARLRRWEVGRRAVAECEAALGFKPGERAVSVLYMTYIRSGLEELESWLEREHAEVWSVVRRKVEEGAERGGRGGRGTEEGGGRGGGGEGVEEE